MYRPVLGRMAIGHFNNKLIAYVNTGITPLLRSASLRTSHQAMMQILPKGRLRSCLFLLQSPLFSASSRTRRHVVLFIARLPAWAGQHG